MTFRFTPGAKVVEFAPRTHSVCVCVCVCVCFSFSLSVYVCVLFVCPTLRRQSKHVSTQEGKTPIETDKA